MGVVYMNKRDVDDYMEEVDDTPEFSRHVIGPLKVLAKVINPKEGSRTPKLFTETKCGHAVMLYDQSGLNMFETLLPGDMIICGNATSGEATDYTTGAFDVIDELYVLKENEIIEIPGWIPENCNKKFN